MLEDQANAPEVVPAASDDLRSQLTAAFEADANAPPADPVAEPSGPARGPDGKFIARDTPAETAPAAAAPAQQTPDAPQPVDASKAPLAPPAGWSDAGKVKWNRLPREIQQELLASPSATDPVQADEIKRYAPLAEVFAPRKAMLQSRGLDEVSAVRHLLSISDYLDADAPAALKMLANAYKVDLAQVASAPAAEQPPVDPQLKSVTDELSHIKEVLATRERTEAAREIEAFKSKAPHFDAVRAEMARLIQARIVPDLQSAYDMATWANPTVRARILEEQQRETREKADQDAKQAAERARSAAVSLTGAPVAGASPASVPAPSLRAELERQFGGRV